FLGGGDGGLARLGAGEDLGDVGDPHARALTLQDPADVHQAGVVGHAQHFRPGVDGVAGLVGAHRGGDVTVLEREGAAEPAALLGLVDLHQVQAAYRAQQAVGTVAQAEHPQPVAGGVVSDPVRIVGAHVGHAEYVYEELGQVVHARSQIGDLA